MGAKSHSLAFALPLSCLKVHFFVSWAAFNKEKDKEKKLDDESSSPTVPQSAFLGPTLWDKTLPYDGDTFQLEYMDLEEFLSENGIPPSPSQQDHSPHPAGLPPAAAAPSVMDLSSRTSAPIHPGISSPTCVQSPVRPGKPSSTCGQGRRVGGPGLLAQTTLRRDPFGPAYLSERPQCPPKACNMLEGPCSHCCKF